MKTRRLTARQMFVLLQMHSKHWPQVAFGTTYAHTRCCLQDKKMLTFNSERGIYEITPLGVATAEAEIAARAARRLQA
jgi:hypothetical protein